MCCDVFHDRRQAGRALARALAASALNRDTLVLGLPRGGVPVAYEVACALQAPLDLVVVRKLGVPGFEECAMGAIASGGVRVLNAEVVRSLGLSDQAVAAVAAREQRELDRRERAYRGDRPVPELRGRTVVLVDDGVATGSTMEAAVLAVRARAAHRIVVTVPVAAVEACRRLRRAADAVVCVRTPEPFISVGEWYVDFEQTSDDEVRTLLQTAC